MTELGLDSGLGRDSPLVPSVEGCEDESVELAPADPIDDVPRPIVLGRFIDDGPIVDPVATVPPSGEILLGLLPIAPGTADVEPRLDDVDPMLVDGDVEMVELVVPTLPNVVPEIVPLVGGQLMVDVVDVVGPIGPVTPVGLVVGCVGLVVGCVGLVADPVGLGGPIGPDTGPVTGPDGPVG